MNITALLTGLLGNLTQYVPESVKTMVKGYGTYITGWLMSIIAALHIAGLDTAFAGVNDDNAAQLFFGGLTAIFIRRAIGHQEPEVVAKIEKKVK